MKKNTYLFCIDITTGHLFVHIQNGTEEFFIGEDHRSYYRLGSDAFAPVVSVIYSLTTTDNKRVDQTLEALRNLHYAYLNHPELYEAAASIHNK